MGAVLGGLCPFPLRLGGDAETGWTAEQHARCCADAVAMGRLAPFARLVVNISGAAAGSVTDYAGMNGIGLAYAPSIAVSGYVATLTWDNTFEDDIGRDHPVNIRTATASGDSGIGQAVATGPVTVEACSFAPSTSSQSTGTVSITVYGSPLETATIGDYGGSLDKQNCEAERIPYADGWLRFFESSRGDAFSTKRDGLVHVENLALARHYAWQTRLAEQYSSNQNPATAGAMLDEWVTVLSLDPRSSDEQKRSEGKARLQLRKGNSSVVIDEMISTLIGDRLVKVWRTPGTLTSPPDWTYGPAWDTGPSTWNLGGGVWSSTRAKLTVEVTEPSEADRADFLESMAQLTRMLDDALPAYMTSNWATGLTDSDDPDGSQGFRLDYDSMDYVGFP